MQNILTVVGMGNVHGDLTANGAKAILTADCVVANIGAMHLLQGLTGPNAVVIGCEDFLASNGKGCCENSVDALIVARLIDLKAHFNNIVFCTCGSGAEDFVVSLYSRHDKVKFICGVSSTPNNIFNELGQSNYSVFDANNIMDFCGFLTAPLVINRLHSHAVWLQIKDKLYKAFGENAPSKLFDGKHTIEKKLCEINKTDKFNSNTTLLITKQPIVEMQRHSVDSLLEILEILRSEDGCKWDKEQTHLSLRNSTLEEAYELVDAVSNNNLKDIQEEIGDLVLQGFFHTKIAKDSKEFDYYDVFSTLCNKLISRHTHIFGADNVSNAAEAISIWEKNKHKEKQYESATDTLLSVPHSMSALMRAYKVCARAAKANFDWRSQDGVLLKLKEELAELEEAIEQGDKKHIGEEIGDVLYVLCSVCRFLEQEPELALNGTTEKFIKRFKRMEELLLQKGLTTYTATDKQMDDCYVLAKKQLREEA